ncbi:MAG: hypothetical protein KJO18_04300 [Acidimicrobiia bacterium]|nr:hypothetical protein [Acidimicrobiia bacterium]
MTTSAAARLVARAYRQRDIDSILDTVDVIVAGAETPWLTAPRLRYWRSRGARVMGIHAVGDLPAVRLLEAGQADERLSETTPTDRLIDQIRLGRSRSIQRLSPKVVRITGHCWPSDRAEIAVAIARLLGGRTAIAECHDQPPQVAAMLGTSEVPNCYQAAMTARLLGRVPHGMLATSGDLAACASAPHRLTAQLEEDLITALALEYDAVVVDGGVRPRVDLVTTTHLHLVRPVVPHLMDAAVALARRRSPLTRLVVVGRTPSNTLDEVRRWIDLPVIAHVDMVGHETSRRTVDQLTDALRHVLAS